MKIGGRNINIKKALIALFIIIIIVFLLIKFIPSFSQSSSFDNIASEDRNIEEETSMTFPSIRSLSSSSGSGASSGSTASVESSDIINNIPTEKKIINVANFKIEVNKDNYDEIYNKIISLAIDTNGYISNSKTEVSEKDVKSGFINIKVPADKFYAILPEIESLGKIESKQIAGEDVTEKYIDIQSRLNNAKKQEQRFLEILQKAETVDEILTIENELNRIREQIEVYAGQIRYMDNMVAFSAININLHEPYAIVEFGIWENIKQTIKDVVNSFLKSISSIMIWLAGALPYITLLIIGYIIYKKKKKRIWDYFSK